MRFNITKMSLAINKTNSVIATDPRIDVRGADKDAKYVIHKGAQLYSTKRVFSNSYSNSSITFNVPPPSERVFIDKKIRVSIPLRLTFAGTGTGGGNLLEYGVNDALRFSPLNNALFNNVTFTLNNATVTQLMSDNFDALMRYENYSQAMHGYSETPSMQDQSQSYADVFGANRNPLGSYNDGLDQAQTPRGGFSLVKIVSNTPTAAVVDCVLCEYIFISPLAFGKEDETGLIGISQMQFTFNLNNGNEASRVWSHNATNGGLLTSVSVEVGPNSSFGQQPSMHMQYLTPRPTQVIPREMSYPYYNIDRNITTIGTVLAGGTSNVVSSNIQVNSIPRRAYIFARRSNNTRTYNDCDAYARIDGISVNWDNLSGQLSNANSLDLFEISRRNGLNMSFSQWYGRNDPNDLTSGKFGVGSVLCIDFARDIGLQPQQCPGLLGNYQFQCNVNITNFSDEDIDYALYVCLVYEGQFSIKDGNTYQQLGVVDPMEVLMDEKSISILDYNLFMRSPSYYGGSLFEKVKKGLKEAAKLAVPMAKAASIASGNPELLPILELAHQYIGKGMQEDKAISKAMKKLGKGNVGGGVAGGTINPLLSGGKKVSKEKLQKRLV